MNKDQTKTRAPGSLEPVASAKELHVVAATWVGNGWLLFAPGDKPVKQWPSDWPSEVGKTFLEACGIIVEGLD